MRLRFLPMVVPAIGLTLMAIMAAFYEVDREAYYHILRAIGIEPFRYPFLDWWYMDASVDCWKRGINVYVTNPCDVLGRVFDYSPLWLRATFIAPGRGAANILGISFDIAFFLSLFVILKPINWPETLIFVLACTSTVVVFALERANADVLLFLMMVGVVVLGTGSFMSRTASYALLLFAGLLKFYPLVGLVTALRESPRTFIIVGLVSACVVLAFVYGYRDEFAASQANIPIGMVEGDRFGAGNLPTGFGVAIHHLPPEFQRWGGALRVALVAVLLIATGCIALRFGRNADLANALTLINDRDRIVLTLGSALIAGCFFAGQNVEYRGVYLIFVVSGLTALHRAADTTSIRTALTRVTVVVLFLMWEALFRHALDRNGTFPQSVPLPYHLFWLVRELLWWYLAAVLVAVLAIFAMQSRAYVTVRPR
jgi:hypothetical protein